MDLKQMIRDKITTQRTVNKRQQTTEDKEKRGQRKRSKE